jgi:hypothetical protein
MILSCTNFQHSPRTEGRIVSIGVNSVAATNLSCRQGHIFLGARFQRQVHTARASFPREELRRTVEPFVHAIINVLITDAVHQGAGGRFAEAIEQLSEVHLTVDAGRVHHLKSIPCLLTNPHASKPPDFFALRVKKISQDSIIASCFLDPRQLWTRLPLYCVQAHGYLPVQLAGLGRALSLNKFFAIHVTDFARIAFWQPQFQSQISRGL